MALQNAPEIHTYASIPIKTRIGLQLIHKKITVLFWDIFAVICCAVSSYPVFLKFLNDK